MANGVTQIRRSVMALALPVTVSSLLQRTEGIVAVFLVGGLPKAKVSGDIHYKAMEIQLGASVDGMLHHVDNVQADNKVVPLIPASQGD